MQTNMSFWPVLMDEKNIKEVQSVLPDIGKTFGPSPDRRTGNYMENPSFTGPPKLLQDPIFFNIRVPIKGLPKGFFYRTGGPAR